MEQAGIIITFPAHSLKLTAEELILRDTSSDPEIIQKVADICKWWLESQLPMEITTSGSTGTPRKISFERTEIIGSIQLTVQALNLRSGMNCLLALDPGFIGGRMMILRSLEIGMNLICLQASSNPLKDINQPIDFTALVPLQLETILADSSLHSRLNSIQTILIGGAPMSHKLRKSAEQLETDIFLSFGMTETLSHIALQKIKPGSQFFKVLKGISISKDNRGCLIINTPTLKSAPIITNDLVDLTATDEFRWLGRYDRVINSGGIKISPEKLESYSEEIILSVLKSGDFFYSSIEDNRLGQKVVLILVRNIQPSNSDLEKMISDLRKKLSAFEFPKEILWVRENEKSAGGKTDRAKTLEKGKRIWLSGESANSLPE